jgi:S-formylglutathione hydrolase FrmB
MALGTISIWSTSIARTTTFHVILPSSEGPFPVLYLLGGLSDDHTGWVRRTSIERYADAYKLMIVMPDGGRGFYVNDPRPGAPQYEDFIAIELIRFIDNWFPTVRSAAGRAVAGLSMGGYGALMLGMRHPDAFSVAASHSGALMFGHDNKLNSTPDIPDATALAASLPKDKYCLTTLATNLKRSGQKLAIRMDCGTEDFLLDANRRLHAHMDKLEIDHDYSEFPGIHDWDYWDAHVPATLRFVMDRLKAQ